MNHNLGNVLSLSCYGKREYICIDTWISLWRGDWTKKNGDWTNDYLWICWHAGTETIDILAPHITIFERTLYYPAL